jgi:hypothetical protein
VSPPRLRIETAATIAALAGLSAWAFWPVGGIEAGPVPGGPAASPSSDLPPAALDLAAFRAPLWVIPPPPPPPPPPPTPAPPPPPLKLQLLAVTRESPSDALVAVLYDPDQDKVVSVRAGERIGARTVQAIDAQSVTIADAAGPRTLLLSPEPAERRP